MSAPAHPAPPVRRTDIQALRALAVRAVVVEHFWPERLTGGYLGVDVFFVISGFLITGHLIRELAGTGRIGLSRLWMRRVRRLLPAALTVVAATAVLGGFVLPKTQWLQFAQHMVTSTFYVQNWALAAESSDYFARSVDTSPLTHLWSLSVEEQFYLVWPLVLIAAAALLRRRLVVRRAVAVAVAGIGAISISFAVALAPTLASAYYSTPLRAWEFAVGALCAVLPVEWIPRRYSALVAAGAGAVLVACMGLYTPAQGGPGAAAILPVLAAGTVILFGSASAGKADRVLGAAPVRWLGASSYSVYLWHWPLLVAATALGGGTIPFLTKLLLLVLTGMLAYLTRIHIEQRFMGAPHAEGAPAPRDGRRASAFVVSSAVVVCLLAAAGAGYVSHAASAAPSVDPGCAGAAVLVNAASCRPAHARPADEAVLSAPSRMHVSGERSGIYCIEDRDAAALRTCSFGARAGTSTTRVALVGDSHAGQWVDPLAQIADARGWHVDLYLKSSCPIVAPAQPLVSVEFPDASASCSAWRSAVASSVEAGGYDAVLTSAYSSSYAGPDGSALPLSAFTSLWRTWTDAGAEVAVLADTPRFGLGLVPDCILATPGDVPCTTPAGTALRPDPLELTATLDAGPRSPGLISTGCDATRPPATPCWVDWSRSAIATT